MKNFFLFCTILILYMKHTNADNVNESPVLAEILDILKQLSERMNNLEESSKHISGRIGIVEDAVSDLDEVYACETPNLSNTYLNVTHHEKVYIYGAEIQVTCHEGYERIGNEYIQCLGRGKWSTTYCTPFDCGAPPQSEFGTYDDGIVTTLNSTVSLSCMEGSALIGDNEIRCDGENGWQGVQYCLERVCFDVSSEDGTNSTECFLIKRNTLFEGTTYVRGHYKNVTDITECVTHCLTLLGDSFYHFITLENPFGSECVCFEKAPAYYRIMNLYDTYFRESKSFKFVQ